MSPSGPFCLYGALVRVGVNSAMFQSAILRQILRRPATAAVVALLLVPAAAAHAQQDTAVVVGEVLDPSRTPLPGVSITVTNQATSVATAVVSNERGQYRTPPLRVGTYDVVVELAGFKRFTRQGVLLNIGDVRNIDAVLAIGNVSESVTVKGEAPLLSTSDSTVGTVITNQQIAALPLNGRDYLQLASLSAGTGPRTSQGVSIGGQAGTTVAFLLDGQDNNSQQITTGHSGQKEVVKPSVDAIQEFKVVTNGYAAEYGRSSSGVVSVSLKGGQNIVHGGAFEYFRDAKFDAKNFFATTKAPYRRNQYGGSFGGPVKQGRTFFFVDFENGIIRRSATTVSTLPIDSVRAGVFSKTITDPLTKKPFAGNVIPANRIDPAAARILSYLPAAQTNAATNNFVYNSPSDQIAPRWDVRIDHVISSSQNVYVRASSQRTDNKASSPLPADAQGNYVSGGGGDVSVNRSVVIVHNKVWSPTAISSVRVGWNRINWDNTVPSQDLRGVGIPGVDSTQPGFSQINITNYRALGVSNVPNRDNSENIQVSGDLTWNKGAHTIKTGVQAYRLATDFLSSQRSSGIFSFNGQYTGDPFADFLLGYASSSSLSKWAIVNYRTPYTHFFVQDDWRAARRLTFNVGLRYELNPPQVDVNDAIANFDLDSDPAHPKLVLAGAEGSDRASRATVAVNNKQFAPRFGLAYSLPGDKTVIRAGAGVFYGNQVTVGGMQSLEINPPNHVRVALTTDRNAAPTIVLSKGYPDGALTPGSASNVNLVSWDRSDKVPTAYQWNVNLQRELPGKILAEVGYNTNHLVNDWRNIDGNPAPPGPGDINARRLIPTAVDPVSGQSFTLANITRIQKDGWSKYRALQTKLERRYSNGLSLLASYTYSQTRSLEGGYQDPNNFGAEVGPSSNDHPHYFVASGVYDLPFGRGRHFGNGWNGLVDAIAGGWAVSPIVTFVSGDPLDLSVNGNPSNSNGTDRPNVIGDWHLDNPTVDQWFNTAAFVANAPYTFGNATRNLLRGPSSHNLDIVVRKSFRLNARVVADVRFESFNATNAVNFGNPNTQLGNANFGKISSAGTARNNQVAVKLSF